MKPESHGVQELVADKGYHSNDILKDLRVLGIRTYIAEPARGRRNWQDNHEVRTLSTPIDGGFVENEGDGCSVKAVNVWSVLSRMHTKQEDFARFICAVA